MNTELTSENILRIFIPSVFLILVPYLTDFDEQVILITFHYVD